MHVTKKRVPNTGSILRRQGVKRRKPGSPIKLPRYFEKII